MDAYASSGVSHAAKEAGLAGLAGWLAQTHGNNPRARVTDLGGYYACVIEPAGSPLSIALSTDSVGTKVLVAQMADRHDTIGIDCVAMNANDVICVGADPLALVDYIGVNVIDARIAGEIAKGLAEGARRAEISIPGGEMAQVRDLVRGHGDFHYDLIGTCMGVVPTGKAMDGSAVEPGDIIVGIASSGLHANGYSLARRIVFETLGKGIGDNLDDCGRSVADELLEPTAMYVRECKTMLRDELPVHALLNITGGSFTNLLRVRAKGVGFVLDALPEPPPVFGLLAQAGKVPAAEMHSVFNMGVGFCVIVPHEHSGAVVAAARAEGKEAWAVGRVVADPERRVAVVRRRSGGALVASKAKGAFTQVEDLPAELKA